MSHRIIALLGRRDTPTDAVEEYCAYVASAMKPLGFETELVRVPWAEEGWTTALADLRRKAASWRGGWVMLQYTALAWSQRGIPFGALRVVRALRSSGADLQTGIVFHDARPYPGNRLVDSARRSLQRFVMRRLYHLADRIILSLPADKIDWLPFPPDKAVFIPIGGNLPDFSIQPPKETNENSPLTVAVYSVTGGGSIAPEAADITFAVRRAADRLGPLRLVVLGRNSLEAEPALRQGLVGSQVELSVLGVVPFDQVVQTISKADVMLFVRGEISSRRTSALAGIACGLPLVAYHGPETAPPVTEAGVVLADAGDRKGLAESLARVLSDPRLRAELRERSRAAQETHFSWGVIAARYAEALRSAD